MSECAHLWALAHQGEFVYVKCDRCGEPKRYRLHVDRGGAIPATLMWQSEHRIPLAGYPQERDAEGSAAKERDDGAANR